MCVAISCEKFYLQLGIDRIKMLPLYSIKLLLINKRLLIFTHSAGAYSSKNM